MKNILDRINGRSDIVRGKKMSEFEDTAIGNETKELEIKLTEPSKTTGLLQKQKYTRHYDF